MRCRYCRKPAGLIRRVCPPCSKVLAVIERTRGQVGLGDLVDIFIAEGLTRDQVYAVLDAQVGDRPTLRDRLTSDLVNVLMRNLGMPGRQSPEDVSRVRRAMDSGSGQGTWGVGGKPPASF